MNISGQSISVVVWIVAIAVLLHYAFYQFGYAINSDNALMIEYAKRWLAGGTYGVDVFDPNPPASFLIYLPAVFLSKILPVWHALTLYTSVLVLLSSLAVWSLLRYCGLDEGGRRVITMAYALGNVFLANIFYGERDHLIFLGLMPLCLLQYTMLKGRDVSGALKYAVLSAGVISVAVKPHYALMPVLLIVWRAINQKRVSVFWDIDVRGLVIGAIAYAAILSLFFAEFIKDVLPVASMVYAPDLDVARLAVNVLVTFIMGLAWLIYSTSNATPASRQFTNFLMIFSVCLTIATLAQLKGYYYHALPQFIVIFVLASYMIYQFWAGAKRCAAYAVPLSVLVVIVLSYFLMPPARDYPTHQSFKTTGVNDLYEECHKPCRIFIFDEYPDIAVMAAVYNDSEFPSRFPSYWFLPEIYAEEGTARDKYQAMVAEDLIRYKPDILALVRTEIEKADGTVRPFDFIEFFSMNTDFAREIKKYEKAGTLVIDRADYHRGTTLAVQNKETFDLYRLKKAD